MQNTITNKVFILENDIDLKQNKAKQAISEIHDKYRPKIDEKTTKLSKLIRERDSVRKSKSPNINDTKKLYSIDKSIKILESDLVKLKKDMGFDINNIFKSKTVSFSMNNIDSLVREANMAIERDLNNINTDKLIPYVTNDEVTQVGANSEGIVAKPTANTSNTKSRPFDMRLYRGFKNDDGKMVDVIPYNVERATSSTYGYFPSPEQMQREMEANEELTEDYINNVNKRRKIAQNDELNIGVMAVNNQYALTTLYGSKGGKLLMDARKQRSWYEVDIVSDNSTDYGFAKNPTTSNIIAWGNSDIYGRTPYQFSDFVLCKYWNVVPNNRMITLRRYPAPVLDNLNYPGMDGISSENDFYRNGAIASAPSINLTPIATAVTYFGDDTSNKLSSILKFTTGLKWRDVTADVYKPEFSDPGDKGFQTISKVSSLLTKLNIFGGNWNFSEAMNSGQNIPDPYTDGPYANRIQGPVNSIKSVKGRDQGLDYKMDGLNIVFEYKARPIGGINTKAILLDILSNFLVLGSANAVFFGGAHRFMNSPKGYPFLGGDEGMHAFYRGEPIKFAGSMVEQAANNSINIFDSVSDMASKIFNAVKSFDIKNIFGSVKNIGSQIASDLGDGQSGGFINNAAKAFMVSRSNGTIPYLKGMRALLIGEPVGDWHLTVGNPLNPIALMGNLICEGIDVEFGDELGPDDFPLDLKITVRLKDGMARDKDAIQSIFNRGMGRIYALPDDFGSSADADTMVDEHSVQLKPGEYYDTNDWKRGGSVIGSVGAHTHNAKVRMDVYENALHTNQSVWPKLSFEVRDIYTTTDFRTPSINNRTEFKNMRFSAESGLT